MKHTIPSTVWETKRAQIAKLYKDEEWPLKQVIKQVRSPDFNPSETQLRSKLKKWRVTKPSRQVRKLPKPNRQLKSPSHPRPPPAQIDVDEDGWSDKASSGSPTVQLESPGKEKGKPSAEEEPATPEDSLPATTRVSKPSLDAWIPPALSENNNNRRYSFPYDPVPPAGWPIQLDTSQWYDSLSTGPGTAGQTNQASTETIYPSPALSQSSGLTCANQGVQSVAVSPHQQTMYSTSLPQSSSSSCSSSSSAILQDNTAEYSYDYLKNWTPWQILPVEDFSTPADVYPYSMYPAVNLNVNMDMYPGQKELDKTGTLGLAVPGTGIY